MRKLKPPKYKSGLSSLSSIVKQGKLTVSKWKLKKERLGIR